VPRNKTKTEDAAPLAEPDAPTPETTPVADQSASETMAVAPPEEFDDDGATSTVDVARAVTFRLAGQLYGLRIEDIQEIQQIAELLPLPDSHPALVGLIEIRGRVVPAIDLRLLVGLEAAPYSLETPMIFCRVRDQLVCLIVDTVEDVPRASNRRRASTRLPTGCSARASWPRGWRCCSTSNGSYPRLHSPSATPVGVVTGEFDGGDRQERGCLGPDGRDTEAAR